VPADQYLSASVPISLGTDSNLRAPAGSLDIGRPADFFTVALDDPSLAGADSQSLLSSVVFSAERSAVRDVVVAGKFGRHPQAGQIIEGFKRLQPDL
jgi:formimidoylglutamate deiminase